jgi:protein TonB
MIAAAVFALIASALSAEPPPPPQADPVMIVQPEWEVRPQGDDIARLFPAAAVKAGASGQAVVQCGVLADGHLDHCQVIAEQPEGMGFGEASVEMAVLFKMKPTMADGSSVDGAQVLIPLSWSLGPKSSD